MKKIFQVFAGVASLFSLDAHADMGDEPLFTFFQADRLEHLARSGKNGLLWETNAWIGRDYNKLWVKSDGDVTFGETLESAEVQALWSRAITRNFDFQAGVRQDFGQGPSDSYAVLGIQGLAPHWFELDTALFLDDDGALTARIEAEYDILLSQRLIAQPRVELDFAAQDSPRKGVGKGLSTAELGLRFRYELRRQFAPYIGINWERAVGNTADFQRLAAEDVGETSFVFGLRFWF